MKYLEHTRFGVQCGGVVTYSGARTQTGRAASKKQDRDSFKKPILEFGWALVPGVWFYGDSPSPFSEAQFK
jgi:hypothetical protein